MGTSKRQQFKDLAAKGGKRKDFIDLAKKLGVGGKDEIVISIEPPAGPKPPGKAKGGLIRGIPKIAIRGY